MRIKNNNYETRKLCKKIGRGDHLFVGIWHVRGTFEEGKLRHLVSEVGKYKFDIVGLQETKQSGHEVTEVGDYIFLNSGGENRRLGMDFLINRELKELILDFQPISERISLIRLRGKYQKITVINIHAPTEEKEIEIKDQFYSELDRIYERIAKYDLKIIIGDTNAKLGREE